AHWPLRRAERKQPGRAGTDARRRGSSRGPSLRILYTLLLRLLLPLALLRLWWRGRREEAYRAHVEERFGHYEAEELLVAPPRLIWIHAVSVGEARAAAPL